MSLLSIRNRQKGRRIDRPLLRKITLATLQDLTPDRPYEICIHLVSSKEMAEVNEHYLQHEGPTDVITFDHAEFLEEDAEPDSLTGEIYICLDVAQKQAREFHTTWQSELARYVVHGILHLCGYCDLEPKNRRKMKKVENRIVKDLSKRFRLSKLSMQTKV